MDDIACCCECLADLAESCNRNEQCQCPNRREIKPKICIRALSIIICILTVVILALNIMLGTGSLYDASMSLEGASQVIDIFQAVIYVLVLLSLIAVVLGFVSTGLPRKYAIKIFGLLILFIMVLMWILGPMLYVIKNIEVETYCQENGSNFSATPIYNDYVHDIDYFYSVVNRKMCSQECPCPASLQVPWTQVLEENWLNQFYGRTLLQEKDGTMGIHHNLVYLYFSDDDSETTYDTFKDCLPNFEFYSEDNSLARDFISMQGIAEWFEFNYRCTGFCEKSLFYYSLSLFEDKPQQNCQEALQDLVSSNITGLSYCLMVTAFVLLVTFSVQLPLCHK